MSKWWVVMMCMSWLLAIAYSWAQRYDAASFHMASAVLYAHLADSK